ncbi:hypothetical protein RFI_14397 [Reticulomyxa filosa]|uniref:CAP-Gly domain-containing protein n=1 Tax=Reticulomyxa filosa TaxID=46433 RepID=X6N9U1_RETFI|nr:hypothetical protein RFI_14397 [Reticulomyxa filosa]|eukprot:ETO22796.1 hypothetical protein RFI_14397 [Reticulomyxa filosa]
MAEGKQIPSVGDVVLVNDRVGIVRYVGPLAEDKGTYFGLEMKGEALKDGHDGTLDNKKYFNAKIGLEYLQNKFKEKFDQSNKKKKKKRVIPPEELLEKVASLYDIIKNNKGTGMKREGTKEDIKDRYFVDKKRHEELSRKYESVQLAYESLMEKCEKLELQNQTLRSQSAHKVNDLSNIDNSHLLATDELLSSSEKLLITDFPSLYTKKKKKKFVCLFDAAGRISHKRDRDSRTLDESEVAEHADGGQGRETMILNNMHSNRVSGIGSALRVARESIEVSATTVQTDILDPAQVMTGEEFEQDQEEEEEEEKQDNGDRNHDYSQSTSIVDRKQRTQSTDTNVKG